jgi:hypothetical protein
MYQLKEGISFLLLQPPLENPPPLEVENTKALVGIVVENGTRKETRCGCIFRQKWKQCKRSVYTNITTVHPLS